MRLVCANHSAYPRVGEGAEAQRLRRAYARREQGEIDGPGYAEIARGYAAEVMDEQAAAGCDLVTDGQVHWYDLVTHPAAALEGLEIRGLLRFFDTNFYVRRPEVTGEISGTIGLASDYTYAAGVSGAEVKSVVTGPYTLARYSLLGQGPYADLPALVMAYADVLASDLAELANAGATLVQIEEPSLLRHPGDAGLVRRALERVTARTGRMTVSLVTYFGDAVPLFRELLAMPVGMLGFDLRSGTRLGDLLAEQGCDRPVALGIVDGRNTRPEDVGSCAQTVAAVAEALARRGVHEVHVQPSCALEYLPRDRARRKLVRLREIVDTAGA